ncbi:serine/threonine protein kinase [Catenulispora sp. GAS73]|uniref:protein kinase domain-containing protein n=1 Tax=Catenulispora sp. GAS73 TaxID=3156269 RepID=UPI0035175E7E
MSETDPVQQRAADFEAMNLAVLGATPLHRTDPATIGPFQVLARLGGGGMGRIFFGRRASQPQPAGGQTTTTGDRPGHRDLVAIKVIRPEYAEDPRFRRRFQREVEAVRRVHGAYTAELVDSGFDDEERLWMATAYIPGLSLSDTVERFGPLPAPMAWRLAGHVGQALAAIADAGIVHRDLKPSNVLLAGDSARVIDFGVSSTADTSSITMTGQQLGTPAFMSPEQADGAEAGTASDVFSLGSVLAFAVTGVAPFGDGSTADVIHRVIYAQPSESVLELAGDADDALADLIRRCLHKDPADRPTPGQIVEAARARTFPDVWPEQVMVEIESRASWSAPTVAISPLEQLTILRRVRPEQEARQPDAPRRRRLAVSVVGLLGALVIAAVAYVLTSAGTASKTSANPQTSAIAKTSSAGGVASSGGRAGTSPTGARPPAPGTAPPKPQSPASAGGPGVPDGTDTGPSAGAPPASSVPTASSATNPGRTSARGTTSAPPGHTPPPSTTSPNGTASPKPSPPPPTPTITCSYYSGTQLTQYGNTGARVKEIQCILSKHGYNIGSTGVDGIFGDDTDSAVRRFQANHHLTVDGQVGDDTWAKLYGAGR